jgi:hypothetical protein
MRVYCIVQITVRLLLKCYWFFFIFGVLVNQPTPWSRVLLQKLTVTELINKLPSFMESEVSLPCSQSTATRRYPEQNKSLTQLVLSPKGKISVSEQDAVENTWT